MSLTLRSSSSTFHENERVTRARQNNQFNRFLSFNENTSSLTENRRRSSQSTPTLIELLEEEEEEFEEYPVSCYECDSCSKSFASEYGLNHHTNMHHPNQSILCSLCNLTFRSHRSLKTHQQRRHPIHQTVRPNSGTDQNETQPDYSFFSSYLVVAFSSRQFPSVAKIACEQKRLPLSTLSSQLYRCHLCHVPFPCSRTLKYHLLDQHDQYEYNLCESLLNDIILEIEENFRTVNDHEDDEKAQIHQMKMLLSKQASQFGLKDKRLAQKARSLKIKQIRQIYPFCQHPERTCANLCLHQLSTYSQLIKNYSFTILTVPKGNPYAQGSIVSHFNSAIVHQISSSNHNPTSSSQDIVNSRQKRRNTIHTNGCSPIISKKKVLTSTPANNGKSTRAITIKHEVDPSFKNHVTKGISTDSSSISSNNTSVPVGQRKVLIKDDYAHSVSLSINSSTSTRSSIPKTSVSSTNFTGSSSNTRQRASKRTVSPTTTNSVKDSPKKRRRTRAQTNKVTASPSSTAVIKINNDDDDEPSDSEQENGDDDVIPIEIDEKHRSRITNQRKDSNESVEYVENVDDDLQTSLSLNNIENLKSKSNINHEDVVVCRSPPVVRKMVTTSKKNQSKVSINGSERRKSSTQKSPNDDERIRVRCKVCGMILKGRRRFSEHVIAMHGHLLIKKAPVTGQAAHQTTFIR